LNADGSLDTTLTAENVSSQSKMTLRSDGKINILEGVYPLPQFSLTRYLDDGTLDPSFNDSLIVQLPASTLYVWQFALQSNKMLVLFRMDDEPEAELLRLNEDGSADAAFGDNGFAYPIGIDRRIENRSPQPQTDNKILVVEVSNTSSSMGVARYLNNGTADPNFGVDGFAEISGITTPPSIRLQGDMKILAGSINDSDFVMVRLLNEIGTSVNETEANTSLSVFPNPASHQLIINYPFSSNEEATIIITDVTGKILHEEKANSSSDHYVLKLSDLLSGIYFLTLKTKSESKSVKLVKEE